MDTETTQKERKYCRNPFRSLTNRMHNSFGFRLVSANQKDNQSDYSTPIQLWTKTYRLLQYPKMILLLPQPLLRMLSH